MNVVGFIHEKVRSWFTRATNANLSGSGVSLSSHASAIARAYGAYAGAFPQSMKPLADLDPYGSDSMAVNIIADIVDTTVATMVSKGVSIKVSTDSEGAAVRQAILDAAWKFSGLDAILHAGALHGELGGDVYLRLDRNDDEIIGTVTALDPRLVNVEIDPDDDSEPVAFYIDCESLEKGVKARQAIVRTGAVPDPVEGESLPDATVGGSWAILDQESRDNGKTWYNIAEEVWPFEWCPVQHCQGNPDPSSFHGAGVRLDVLKLNDDLNFVLSGVKRVLRLYTSPWLVATGVMGSTPLAFQVGKILSLPGSAGMGASAGPRLEALELPEKIDKAMLFAESIRGDIYRISRVPNMSDRDNLGSISGTALKVMYAPLVDKTRAKQALMGDLFERTSGFLLEMAGFEAGEVVVTWPDPTPQNKQEEVENALKLVTAGVISKHTAATSLGFDADEEAEKIAKERSEDVNTGGQILDAFNRE